MKSFFKNNYQTILVIVIAMLAVVVAKELLLEEKLVFDSPELGTAKQKTTFKNPIKSLSGLVKPAKAA